MRKRQRLAFLAIGGLGLLAAIAPGLAAGIAVPTGTSVPSAGQGIVSVEGFHVCDINWVVNDSDLKVTQVTFRIERDSDDTTSPRKSCGDVSITSTVDSAADGNSLDAVVRVQLQKSSTPHADWAGCATTAGAATCTLTGAQQMLAADLANVNIIAFDRD